MVLAYPDPQVTSMELQDGYMKVQVLLEENHLLHDSQSGFRTSYSTEMVLLKVSETIKKP